VLVMQTHVIREEVQRAVVGEGFRDLGPGERVLGRGRLALEDVVLGDEVAGGGMQRAGEEGAEDQIVEGIRTAELDEHVVEEDLRADVDEMDAGEWDLVDADGSQRVEQDLEGAEKGLSEDRVEKYGFEGGGKVSVEPIDAEGFVVR